MIWLTFIFNKYQELSTEGNDSLTHTETIHTHIPRYSHMETFVGGHGSSGEVLSVSCNSDVPTSFVSSGSDGTIVLWDTRPKKKNVLTIRSPFFFAEDSLTEVAYAARGGLVAASCGSSVCFVDLRRTMDLVGFPLQCGSSDLVQLCVLEGGDLLNTPAATTADIAPTSDSSFGPALLAVDEEGLVSVISLQTLTFPVNHKVEDACRWWDTVEQYGQHRRPRHHNGGEGSGTPSPRNFPTWSPSLPSAPSTHPRCFFGEPLDNICCGLAISGCSSCSSVPMCVWTASSISDLFGYSMMTNRQSGRRVCQQVVKFNTGSELSASQPRRELVNPPLPMSIAASHDHLLALGRADGTYSLYEVSSSSDHKNENDPDDCRAKNELTVEEVLSAPAHEGNGLVAVRWTLHNDDAHLLTLALSGEVTVWNCRPLIVPVEEEDDANQEGELPEVLWAETVPRRRRAAMNSMDLSRHGRIVIGDTSGDVHTTVLQ